MYVATFYPKPERHSLESFRVIFLVFRRKLLLRSYVHRILLPELYTKPERHHSLGLSPQPLQLPLYLPLPSLSLDTHTHMLSLYLPLCLPLPSLSLDTHPVMRTFPHKTKNSEMLSLTRSVVAACVTSSTAGLI